MLIPTAVMGALALFLVAVGYHKGQGQHIAGLRAAFGMTLDILPLLACSFIVAGMTQALLPRDLLARWVGTESGIRGIIVGSVAGAFAPGGPYVSFPIVAGLLQAGAGVGTLVAFLTAWSVWALARLPLEVGVIGWRFALIRMASTFLFPPIAGLIARGIAAAARFG